MEKYDKKVSSKIYTIVMLFSILTLGLIDNFADTPILTLVTATIFVVSTIGFICTLDY